MLHVQQCTERSATAESTGINVYEAQYMNLHQLNLQLASVRIGELEPTVIGGAVGALEFELAGGAFLNEGLDHGIG